MEVGRGYLQGIITFEREPKSEQLLEKCPSVWMLGTVSNGARASLLKAKFGTWENGSISQNIQFDIQMVLRRMFVGSC